MGLFKSDAKTAKISTTRTVQPSEVQSPRPIMNIEKLIEDSIEPVLEISKMELQWHIDETERLKKYIEGWCEIQQTMKESDISKHSIPTKRPSSSVIPSKLNGNV